jgi:RNase P/RNase MRP subunit POP5
MTVKSKRGRRRYVYFEAVGGKPVPRENLIRSVITPAEAGKALSLKIIQFDGTKGIARCFQKDLEPLKMLLNEKKEGTLFRTICTSGTIKTLREKYFHGERPPRSV